MKNQTSPRRPLHCATGTRFGNKIFAAALCLFILTGIFAGITASAESGGALSDGIIAYKENATGASSVQEWLDGELTAGAGATSEWYVIAVRQSGEKYDYASYVAALRSYIAANKTVAATSRQRIALALVACGCADDPFVTSTLSDSIGEQGVMSWIFGLHLLNNGCESDKYTAAEVVDRLLSLRLSDGGWALTGSVSDVDVTAMAISALAPHYSDVKAAVDGALALLSEKQLENGGYMGFGAENPESTSQVIIALSSLGIDTLGDPRFIKEGNTLLDGMLKFKLADGSFCHTYGGSSNGAATYQAFISFIAMHREENGLSPLFVFSSSGPQETSTPDASEPEAPDASEPEAVSQSSASQGEPVSGGYKLWACLAVIGAAAVVCAVLWLCKKRRLKNYLLVLIIAGLAALVILVTNFQNADSYYREDGSPSDTVGTVTLTIRCDTVVGKSDSEYIPADGVILPVTEFGIAEGESVFDVLVRAAKKYNIQIENKGSAAYGMTYISGINYLYELDFGDLSGWIYHVNGSAPSVGCGEYTPEDGDVIEWLYSCELGNDLK